MLVELISYIIIIFHKAVVFRKKEETFKEKAYRNGLLVWSYIQL